MTQPTRRAAAILAALALALVPAGCGGGGDEAERDTGTPGEAQNPAPDEAAEGRGEGAATAGNDGRGLFQSGCASCHTLAAADASGTIGVNLDEEQPSQEEVLRAIEEGPGQMPANLYEGTQARAVAEFVAQNVGR